MLLKRIYDWLFPQPLKVDQEHFLEAFQQIYVQPCMIKGRPFIVYPRGLKEQSPEVYTQLDAYYTAKGYSLKEDQRSQDADEHQHERRRWAPIVLFTATLLFETNAHADVEIDYTKNAAPDTHQVSLHMVPADTVRKEISAHFPAAKDARHAKNTAIKSVLANSIYNILSRHYIKNDSDPQHIGEDLKEMANYYSGFPEVVAMLEKLDQKKWQLKFDEDNWVTVASGNVFQVDNAVIHFNTRAAAQLRLNNKCKNNPVCIASPADALLHELLHTYSMLINTDRFISQGGMSNVMYPYKHEYAVIEKERKLYAMMSRQDNLKRPQRSDHTGRTIKVNCPTCIK